MNTINVVHRRRGVVTPLDPEWAQERQIPISVPSEERDERPMTLHWASDIEQATAALVWHHPDLVVLLRRELDLELHISIPAYRKIIEAVAIVHGEIGEADWPCVVHAIRELGAFEECGGLQGLCEVYSGHYSEGWRNPELFLREYIRLLKEYGLARKIDPYRTVRRYTAGRGFLAKNKLATKPQHPVVTGKASVFGHKFSLAGWPDGEGVKFTFELVR